MAFTARCLTRSVFTTNRALGMDGRSPAGKVHWMSECTSSSPVPHDQRTPAGHQPTLFKKGPTPRRERRREKPPKQCPDLGLAARHFSRLNKGLAFRVVQNAPISPSPTLATPATCSQVSSHISRYSYPFMPGARRAIAVTELSRFLFGMCGYPELAACPTLRGAQQHVRQPARGYV